MKVFTVPIHWVGTSFLPCLFMQEFSWIYGQISQTKAKRVLELLRCIPEVGLKESHLLLGLFCFRTAAVTASQSLSVLCLELFLTLQTMLPHLRRAVSSAYFNLCFFPVRAWASFSEVRISAYEAAGSLGSLGTDWPYLWQATCQNEWPQILMVTFWVNWPTTMMKWLF